MLKTALTVLTAVDAAITKILLRADSQSERMPSVDGIETGLPM